MSKVAVSIRLPVNQPVYMEDDVVDHLAPYIKAALFPGSAVLPQRDVVVIIEVLGLEEV